MARDDKKNVTPFQLWLEDAWEGWIKPLGVIVLLAIGYLLYKFDIIGERTAGVLAICAVALGAIVTGVLVALPLTRAPWQRAMVLTAAAAALVATLYPTLRIAVPGEPLAEGMMTTDRPSVTLTTGRSGPYDLMVSAHFKDSGRSDEDASYTIKATDNSGGSDEITGDISRTNEVFRSRKGSTTALAERTEQRYRLPDVRGATVKLTTDGVDEKLDGLAVTLLKGGLPPVVFIILGALALAMGLVLDTRLVDTKGKQKSYLTATLAIAFVFALEFPKEATTHRLVGPAVSEFLFALVVGGLAGWAAGGLARLLFGPKIKKAKSAR